MNTRRLSHLSAVVALLAATSALFADVTVKMADLGEGKVRVTFTNDSDNSVAIARYQTPLDGLDTNLFLVERDGQEVPYVGRLALRLGPVDGDWFSLGAKDSISAEVDLAQNYAMDRAGYYTAQYSFPLIVKNLDGSYENLTGIEKEVISAPVTFKLNANLYVAPEYVAPVRANHNIVKCNGSQKSNLETAMGTGQELCKKSYDSLANAKSDQRYVTWWGTYSDSNANRVRSNFKKTDDSFNTRWTLTCTQDSNCKQGVLAYVYPDQAFSVYICDYFNSGGFTKNYMGSLLLHESTHWKAVAGTTDHGYGAKFCKNLATQSAAKAVQNADTYRFYALDLVGEAK